MTERSSSHEQLDDAGTEYYYRRPVRGRELLPAIGAAVAFGLAGFYVARVLMQRTLLVPPAGGAPPIPRPWAGRSGRGG